MSSPTAVATAPGKLFLTGEYVVLGGAPALVLAVDRRARVEATLQAGPLVVESVADGTCDVIADPLLGELPGGDARAVVAAARSLGIGAPTRIGGTVRVDSRTFLADGRKLGLGRSAAALVAAVAALSSAAGSYTRARTVEAAIAGHALLQNGLGSGADVAAAVHGGLVEVRRRGPEMAVVPRGLPIGLHVVVGWSGESAATTPLLARFAGAREHGARTLSGLAAEAERAAAAVAAGDAEGLLAATDASGRLLERLGHDLDLPIVTPGLARLVSAARGLGIAVKPSGAGGGDCGVALARSAGEAAALEDAWRAAGIEPLALGLAAEGVALG
jgi:phosphomevalonate kinase